MTALAIAALIRLAPYTIVLIVALRRNYPRLALATLVAFIMALCSTFFSLTRDQLAIGASIFAFLLMMHALRLPERGERR